MAEAAIAEAAITAIAAEAAITAVEAGIAFHLLARLADRIVEIDDQAGGTGATGFAVADGGQVLTDQIGVGRELQPAGLAAVVRLDCEGLALRGGKLLESIDASLERRGTGGKPEKQREGGGTHETCPAWMKRPVYTMIRFNRD